MWNKFQIIISMDTDLRHRVSSTRYRFSRHPCVVGNARPSNKRLTGEVQNMLQRKILFLLPPPRLSFTYSHFMRPECLNRESKVSNCESLGGGASVTLNMHRGWRRGGRGNIFYSRRTRYNSAHPELARQSAVESTRRAQSKFVPAYDVRYLNYKQLRS